MTNLNQYKTDSYFNTKQNKNRVSIEDLKGEIISIHKKHPGENTFSKNSILIENKQLSNFNNLKPLNNNQNLINKPIDNLIQTKSLMNESNNNLSIKNLNNNNNNSNHNNSFLRSKSTSNDFFGPHIKKINMRNTVQDGEQNIYVTQSIRNGLQGLPENLERKYDITSKNSVNSWNAINKIFNKRNQGFYCPHCEHCNNIQDENLEQYFAMKEAKNIIRKGFDYICEYYENNQSFLDFLINMNQGGNSINNNANNANNSNNNNLNLNNSGSNFNFNNTNYNEKSINNNLLSNIKSNGGNLINREIANNSNGFRSENKINNQSVSRNVNLSKKNRSLNKSILTGELDNSHFPKGQNNQNYNMNIINGELENIKKNKKSTKFDLEALMITYPKLSTDRNVLQLVTHFLDALVNDKICLDYMVSPEIFDKLKESLIAQGLAFRATDTELDFDKEIDILFDETTREKIKKLFKSKFLFLFLL